MATEKQIAANRANAAKGGPKTQEGKDRCKMNALKHGLTAKSVIVLPTESKEDFQHLRQGLVDSFHPQCFMELTLVEKLSVIQWKWNRKEAAEAGLLWAKVVEERHQVREACEQAGKSYDHVTGGEFLGLNFLKTKNTSLEKFLRYAASIDREFHKTLDELLRMIKLRDKLASPSSSEPADATSVPANAASSPSHTESSLPSGAQTPLPSRAQSPLPSRAESPLPSRAESPLPSRAESPLLSRTESPLLSRTESPLLSRAREQAVPESTTSNEIGTVSSTPPNTGSPHSGRNSSPEIRTRPDVTEPHRAWEHRDV